ncbi:vomeronasal type-2 receptor 26-like [Pelobates cultripes]|uniref:Vomeronasal type-2 receptor 26-like n=1 Tax=Pelobates cultripes TaxID=61616 RepID=A0AAD1W9R6_PELCU|nr:vomeronasal type-2 receptor 26-like [Pelobates cultripes]
MRVFGQEAGYSRLRIWNSGIRPENYVGLLAFFFAINEINENSHLLPNFTLGFHLFDSCGDEKKAIKTVLRILSGDKIEAPNYSCREQGTLAAFIGDQESVTTFPLAQILSLYGYTQISFGATDQRLSDRKLYPYFFRTVQDKHVWYVSVVKLLRYFGWNYIGIITSEDEGGEHDLRELRKELTYHEVCIEFAVIISPKNRNYKYFNTIQKSASEVIIAGGTCSAHCTYLFEMHKHVFQNKTLILPFSWTFSMISGNHFFVYYNGSFTFAPYKANLLKVEALVENISPLTSVGDPLLEDIWIIHFRCYSPQVRKNLFFQYFYEISLTNCTGKERLSRVMHEQHLNAYFVYTAVYVLAHALHKILESVISAYNPTHYKMLHMELSRSLYYSNIKLDVILFKNREGGEIIRIQLPEFSFFDACPRYRGRSSWQAAFTTDRQCGTVVLCVVVLFVLPARARSVNRERDNKLWKTNARRMPEARCSDSCHPGYRKATKGYHVCCYDCVPCSEGEFSNVTGRNIYLVE